jgi:hypothetical protein
MGDDHDPFPGTAPAPAGGDDVAELAITMAKEVGLNRVAQRPELGVDVPGSPLQGIGVDDGVPDSLELADVFANALDGDLSQEVI